METPQSESIPNHIIAAIGGAVFAETGPLELRALGEVPQQVREMFGPQFNAKTNVVSLEEHGFLENFIADIRNRLSRRQEIDRDSTFFQERNADGRVFASKVWYVGQNEQRLYCIQPSDETDDYKRVLLQRIRSAALEASCAKTAAPGITTEVDNEFISQLIEALGDPIGIVDYENDQVLLNTKARDLLDLPSSLPNRIDTGRLRSYLADTFFPEDRFSEFWKSLIATEYDTIRVRRARPFEIELQLQSIPLNTANLGLWKIEERTRSSERSTPADLSSKEEDDRQISRLTGGIAHEFNNLLTPIIGNLSLLDDQLDRGEAPSTEPLHEAVSDSLSAALRATKLITDLVLCSDKSTLSPNTFDANSISLELAEEFHSDGQTNCSLQLDLDNELWPVSGDPTLLKSVVTKLLDNAIDAGTSYGGIRLTTRNCNLTDTCNELEPGGYIVISVGDHGPGIPKELTSRIFEPFFSSKPQGEGVGLGLASSMGIARRHGGTVTCSSSNGEGATFSLFLPRAKKPIKDVPVISRTHVASNADVNTERRTVLIVDDDPLVRKLSQLTLENSNYQVMQAEDGIDALAIIDANPGKIDLILLDLTMPRMSGPEMLGELERRGSSIPVIVCTGFLAKTEDLTGLYSGGPSKFVIKPFHPSALLDEVHQELLS